MTPTPQDRIRGHLEDARIAVLAELDTIPDPVTRQAAARDVLETLLPALSADVKALRGRAVTELRQGRTLAQVGELLGGLSVGRVDQILKGR